MFPTQSDRYVAVEVDAGFLLLAAGAVLLAGLDTILALFSAVLLHECAHALASGLCGGRIERIRFEFSGMNLVVLFDRAISYGAEILCAAAGPVFNIALGTALAFFAKGYELLYTISGANIILGVFNLIPAGRFDGGSILTSLSERFFPPRTAYLLVRAVSVLFGIAVAVGGAVLFWKSGRNITLLICGIFLSWSLLCDKIKKKAESDRKNHPLGPVKSLMNYLRV